MLKTRTILLICILACCWSCKNKQEQQPTDNKNLINPVQVEKSRVLAMAKKYSNVKPVTVTYSVCERSAGGKHDFYSEGDYWWPDPKNPDGPYIRRDGMTNPENFTADRKAMIRLNQIAGSLTSAYLITKDTTYLQQLIPHLKAWFVDEATKMNPNMLYGQAIKGKVTGRGIGIIDTVHLIELAESIGILEGAGVLSGADKNALHQWFRQYLHWLSNSDFGKAERDNGNNHSVTWAEQVAAFAYLLKDQKTLAFCRNFYKKTLLPEQMDYQGAFQRELSRTKPYGYSIFVLDAMTTLCQILTIPNDNLFTYTTPDGRGIKLGLEFLYPYLKNKQNWSYPNDVLHWKDWPVQQPCLLFAGLAFENDHYLKLWKKLPANYSDPEVIRNMPVKYPLLWLHKNQSEKFLK